MRHYVMTSSARGPEYPIEASRRRIILARDITARSLAAQGAAFTWLVFVRCDDPLLAERLDAFGSAGRPVVPVANVAEAEAAIDWSGPVLTTRIDDDDAFAVGAFDRLYAAVERTQPRYPTAYIFPIGHHVRDGMLGLHRHLRNAWASVYSPPGYREHVRLHQHQRIPAAYPTVFLDDEPAWLRVSHADNDRPTSHRGRFAISAAVRARYAVDWSLLERRAAA